MDPWGPFPFSVGQTRLWQVGPLTMCVQRLSGEWRLTWQQAADSTLDAVSVAEGEPLTEGQSLRVAARAGTLLVRPALPDRPVVARPDLPFVLLPREDTTLYLSSPVWLRLTTEDDRAVADVPTWRSSDTWFGPSQIEGEPCYMSKTQARLQLPPGPQRRARITTEVHVQNRSEAALHLERVKLPVASLPVFADADGALWTPPLTILRKPLDVELTIGRRPAAAKDPHQVAPARSPDANVLVRALSALVV